MNLLEALELMEDLRQGFHSGIDLSVVTKDGDNFMVQCAQGSYWWDYVYFVPNEAAAVKLRGEYLRGDWGDIS